MRVLLAVDSLDGGGAERHVVDLARALRSRGVDVRVACSADGVRRPDLDAAGVPVTVLGGRLVKRRVDLRYALALHGLLRASPVDVVHAHVWASEVAAGLAVAALGMRGQGVPLVLTEHTEAPWRGRTARAWSRWAYRRADALVAVSAAIARLLVDAYGAPAERVRVVTPAVLPPPAARVRRSRPGTVVGYVGRLVPEKGVDVLLEAFALLRRVEPGARLVVVGDGPERDRLAAAASRLEVAEAVDLLGYRADARDLLAGLDVLAVPSRSDGTPLVVAEAMAAGVPVVASDVGGLPDRVRPGVDGLLVPPGRPEPLARALLAVLGDRVLAARLSRAGRAAASASPHTAMVDEVVGVYGALLPGRAAAGDGGSAALGAAADSPVDSTHSHSLWRTGVV